MRLVLRTVLAAGAAGTVVNLAILGVGHLLGADMLVRPPGSPPMEVDVANVVLTPVPLVLVGGLVLGLVGRRGRPAWRATGWLGLAVGLITVAAPLSVEATTATTATTLTLASMHVATGAVWLAVVQQGARHLGVIEERQHSAVSKS